MVTGQDLRAAREAKGVGLGTLAERIGRSKGHLSKVERGIEDRAVTPALIRDYQRALGVAIVGAADADVAPAPSGSSDVAVATAPEASNTEQMLRRTLIMVLAAYGVDQSLGPAPGGRRELTADIKQSDSDRVEQWREAASEYGYDYLSAPRTDLIADLGADLLAVQGLLARLSDPIQERGLSAVAARLAGLMAMACTDLGYSREVKHTWRLARSMADASGEPGVQLWVRGHETTGGSYRGRPLPIILELAERGLAIGTRIPSAGRAELLGGKAQALALQGRQQEATATLGELEHTFERLPQDVTGQSDSIYGWPEHRLRHAESFVYTTIGSTTRAVAAQDRALELYPLRRPISRSQIELHRAVCLVRAGDVGEGIRHGSLTLESTPVDQRKQLVLTIAAMVWRAIPESERSRPDALVFRDQIIAAGNVASPAGDHDA